MTHSRSYKRAPSVLTTSCLVACGSGAPAQAGTGPGNNNPPPPPPSWAAFHIDDIKAQLASQGGGFLEFLNEGALRAGLYHLAAGAVDNQDAHGQDEVYYVVNGSARLSVDGQSLPVTPGDVHYVKAGESHRFMDITADLDLIVVFSKTTPPSTGASALSFTMNEMLASRDGGRNVWNPFLSVSTMIFGMYMLPQNLGGDGDLTHTVDEINIVVNGSSTFTVDGDDVDIRPGSIVFVERGAPHRFRNLSADIDVLILWNQ